MNTVLKKISFGLIVLLIGFSCSISNNNYSTVHCFQEDGLSFFDPTEAPRPDSNKIYTDWIRKPENIKMVHESFKRIGYQKIIDYGYFWNWSSDKRPLRVRIDSLIITFKMDSINSKYYREFWQRRQVENIDEIVYTTLIEIQKILDNESISLNSDFVNDTLVHLVNIQLSEDSLHLDIAKQNFDYLKSVGLHQSAYNTLIERYSYYNIDWNSSELIKELSVDSSCSCINPWIKDNTK